MVLPKDCSEICMGRWGEKKIICAKWTKASFLHASLFVSSVTAYECAIFRPYTKSILGGEFPLSSCTGSWVLLPQVVFSVYMLSFSCSVSVLLLSCVDCPHLSLKSETDEGEHWWAYYTLIGYLPKKYAISFLITVAVASAFSCHGIEGRCLLIGVPFWWPVAFTVTPKDQMVGFSKWKSSSPLIWEEMVQLEEGVFW